MATTAEAGKPSKREELLELLRAEWRDGFRNAVMPGGMRAILEEFRPVVPPEVFAALRNYSILDTDARKKAITLAGKLLSQPPTPLTPGPSPSRGEGRPTAGESKKAPICS